MRTLSKAAQKLISPEQAIELLKEGNKRFLNNLAINRNLLEQISETSNEQYPFAAILSCIDSRIPAEIIFDQGLGDILSIRIAGNVLNDDILGSMEFACKVASSKLIVVLGHTKCGAIKGACEGVQMGNLTTLLNKLTPVINNTKQIMTHESAEDPKFMEKVAALNVEFVMQQILERSPILAEMIAQEKIGIIGGIYDIGTGKVNFFNS